LIVGSLGAIAGVWGMNFEVEYFKAAETGFWLTIGAMGLLVIGLTALARFMRWI
jgi:magnesium transporter